MPTAGVKVRIFSKGSKMGKSFFAKYKSLLRFSLPNKGNLTSFAHRFSSDFNMKDMLGTIESCYIQQADHKTLRFWSPRLSFSKSNLTLIGIWLQALSKNGSNNCLRRGYPINKGFKSKISCHYGHEGLVKLLKVACANSRFLQALTVHSDPCQQYIVALDQLI